MGPSSPPPVPETPTTPAAESAPNGLSTVSHEYLKGSYGLDLEAVRGGASNLPHLTRTLATSCRRLHSEVDKVLSGLEILSKVFDQQSSPMVTRLLQQQVGLWEDAWGMRSCSGARCGTSCVVVSCTSFILSTCRAHHRLGSRN